MTFSQRLVEYALAIPAGRVTTYGHLARAAGGGGQAARSVASILSKYPNHKAIPWHRIVYASGKVWLTDEHEARRRELFALEDVQVNQKGHIQDFEEVLWDPSEASL